LAEVEGTMTFQGQPKANVLVAFMPEMEGVPGQRSTGVTDENGHFVLKTDDGRPGAVVGRHRVMLTVSRRTEPGKKGEAAEPRVEAEQLPLTYATAATTPLRRDVKEGKQVLDLVIE
jgi:hypothetical protein